MYMVYRHQLDSVDAMSPAIDEEHIADLADAYRNECIYFEVSTDIPEPKNQPRPSTAMIRSPHKRVLVMQFSSDDRVGSANRIAEWYRRIEGFKSDLVLDLELYPHVLRIGHVGTMQFDDWLVLMNDGSWMIMSDRHFRDLLVVTQ